MNSRSNVLPNRNKFELGHQTIDALRERTRFQPLLTDRECVNEHRVSGQQAEPIQLPQFCFRFGIRAFAKMNERMALQSNARVPATGSSLRMRTNAPIRNCEAHEPENDRRTLARIRCGDRRWSHR